MIFETFKGMIYNAALLLALGIVFESVVLSRYYNRLGIKILTGLSLGAITLAIMLNPFTLTPGVVFDTRTILLSLSTLFLGLIPGAIAAVFGLAFRMYQGGSGQYMGYATIITAVMWGFIWRVIYRSKSSSYNFKQLYTLGLVTHITMLLLTLLLPSETRWHILRVIAIPVLVIYPLATVVLGRILTSRAIKQDEKELLKQSEEQFRNLYFQAPIAYQSLDAKGNFLSVNKFWLDTLGYKMEDIVGNNFADILDPLYAQKFRTTFPAFISQGHIEGVEFVLKKKDGSKILVNFNGKILRDVNGNFISTQCVFTDITEKRQHEAELKSIEWMLSKTEDSSMLDSSYGDLSSVNSDRLILDSVGKETLAQLVSDYLSLLDTSSAVYEKNGDYASGFYSSGWCQYLDSVSRKRCDTMDNQEAITGGKWICHESWKNMALEVIQTGQMVDRECSGGIRLYVVPITNTSGVIGAMALGYGSPPEDDEKLQQIAERYELSLSDLREKASAYRARPPFVIEQAKRKLQTAAKIIGEIVERKQAEEQRNRYASRLEILRAIDSIVLETLSVDSVCELAVTNLQSLIPFQVLSVNVIRGSSLELIALNKTKNEMSYLQKGKHYTPDPSFLDEIKHEACLFRTDLRPEDISEAMPIASSMIQDGMKSFMYNAIAVRGELYGFLWFASDQADFFNDEYCEIAREFANQLAVVLQHLRMVDTIRDHANLLELKVEERTAQLKTANAELEAFSYTAAHDLRSPLRVIDGYCKVLSEDYSDILKQDALDALQTIIRTTHRMDLLINELLQLARLSHEKIQKTDVNMKEIAADLVTQITEAKSYREHKVDIGDLPSCAADHALIRQVWQNLIENAFKFSSHQPEKQIQIGCNEEAWEYIYFVKDNGVGLPKESLEHIFEPFRRFHKSSEFEGTGIGLAIVKKIILNHNGRVWAESAPGEGATLFFSIPKIS